MDLFHNGGLLKEFHCGIECHLFLWLWGLNLGRLPAEHFKEEVKLFRILLSLQFYLFFCSYNIKYLQLQM